jgi:hypothetical protein
MNEKPLSVTLTTTGQDKAPTFYVEAAWGHVTGGGQVILYLYADTPTIPPEFRVTARNAGVQNEPTSPTVVFERQVVAKLIMPLANATFMGEWLRQFADQVAGQFAVAQGAMRGSQGEEPK